MIRIAIVEDEKEYVDLLRKYLERYEKENDVRFQISTFTDGLDIASEYKAEYDIILLDIQMKHMNGMDAAGKIRSLDEDVSIIFITSTVQFAVQGYLVDALGYVLKPVPYLAFAQVLRKAVKKALAGQEQFALTVDTQSGQMKVDAGQIYYIESQKHSVIIHSSKGEYRTAGPLKRMEELLGSHGFFKCHHAYLVNLKHTDAVLSASVCLSTGEELPISRARKKPFMDALSEYIGGSH